MKCQSTYMIKSKSMPDEITSLGFSHAVVQIFCTVVFKNIMSLTHVAFTKVMLKLKEQLQIVSDLLLQECVGF